MKKDMVNRGCLNMTTKHTPGPWWVDDDGFIASGTDETYRTIADPRCSDMDSETHEANARLIAAAPDLLVALQAVLPALIRLGDFVGNADEGGASGMGRIDRCALILEARAAIARATKED